jgi:hypothetical protein
MVKTISEADYIVNVAKSTLKSNDYIVENNKLIGALVGGIIITVDLTGKIDFNFKYCISNEQRDNILRMYSHITTFLNEGVSIYFNPSLREDPNFEQKINGKISDTNIRQAISLDKTLTKRIKNEKIEFSSKEIPEINNEFNFDKYDPPNIEILRKEYEKHKEEKNMKNKLSSLKRYTLLNRVSIPKETIFNSEKLTFDPDGQIIEFKPINMNILVNDFKKINHKLGVIEPLRKLSLKRNSKIRGTKRNSKKKFHQ